MQLITESKIKKSPACNAELNNLSLLLQHMFNLGRDGAPNGIMSRIRATLQVIKADRLTRLTLLTCNLTSDCYKGTSRGGRQKNKKKKLPPV